MKRILLPAALVLALSGAVAFAQEPAPAPTTQAPAPVERHHAQDPHKAAMKMSKKLNLTADQTAKLEPILVDRDKKVAALQANPDLDPKDRRKQMHAIQKDTEQQLSSFLTPDQIEQMKAGRKGHHGHETQPLTPSAPTA